MYVEKIDSMIMSTRKAGDTKTVLVYQALKNEFLKHKTSKNAKPIDEAVEFSIIRKMIKERLESAEMYSQANRAEAAADEKFEADVLNTLLPAGPSEDDLKKEIEAFISSVDVFDKKQMGACIKTVKAKFPTADGKTLSTLVQSYLN